MTTVIRMFQTFVFCTLAITFFLLVFRDIIPIHRQILEDIILPSRNYTVIIDEDSGYLVSSFTRHQRCDASHLSKESEFYLNLTKFEKSCNVNSVHNIEPLRYMDMNEALGHLVSPGILGGVLGIRNKCPQEPLPGNFSRSMKIGLVSYPGSGNTWVRHIIQQMTGIQTGSIFHDHSLRNNGFPGEGKLEDVIVIKSHALDRNHLVTFQRQIVLIRNPFDAFAAEYQRGKLDQGHAAVGHIDHTSKEWTQYVERSAVKWAHCLRLNLDYPQPTMLLFYEDLKSCPLPELLSIASFLIKTGIREYSLCCALQNSQGNFHRNSTRPSNLELYPEHLRQVVNQMLEDLAMQYREKRPIFSSRLLDYRLYLSETT